MAGPRATASDVAKLTGVSAMTVSRALSGKAPVAAATRQRIQEAAKALGYRPNQLAAGLRGSQTRSIGVIWAFVDPWDGDAGIALDVLERMQRRGFATYQAQHSERVDRLCECLDDLLSRRVDAIVIRATPPQLNHPKIRNRLEQAPAVLGVTREAITGFPGDLVIQDRYQAFGEVIEHLAQTGRKRPALVLSVDQEANAPKYDVFLERCREHGLADHPHTLVNLAFPFDPGVQGRQYREGFRRAFPKKVPVDAVFCVNDVGAMFVMQDLLGRGLRIPEDVALIGFNNIEACQAMTPQLASCDRRFGETADAIERLLAWRLEHPDEPPQIETIHMTFVRRASAG